MPITMPAAWIHGSRDCASDASPDLQIHRADRATWIFRQNKCANAEGPFLYLIAGSARALLLDTGADPIPGRTLPLRGAVDRILGEWEAENHLPPLELIVAHTHGHSDHAFGDAQFWGRARTQVVGTGVSSIKRFFGLDAWPRGSAALELGGRPLTVVPAPGHEQSHIAIYDGQTQSMFTGDVVYPGVLVVADWRAFRTSIAALADHASRNPVQHVLGAHIEMKRTPREFYAPRTAFQPDEHALPLAGEHLELLRQAVQSMGPNPRSRLILSDFVIEPV